MKNLLRCMLILSMSAATVWPQAAHPQASPDAAAAAAVQHPITETQLRTYMEESMLLSTLETQAQDQLEQIHKTSLQWFPDATWKIVKENLASIDLVKVMLPVYEKYFTEQDGKALPLIYEGPTGHAFALASVQAGTEAAHAGLDPSAADRAAQANYLGSARELAGKRQAELTPEQIVAVRQMQMDTAVKTLDGLRVDEEQNQLLAKTIDGVLHAAVAAHRKELMAAQRAYNAKH